MTGSLPKVIILHSTPISPIPLFLEIIWERNDHTTIIVYNVFIYYLL